MALYLNRTGNDITRVERLKINENWAKLENNFNDVVNVISDEAFQEVVDSAKLIWKEPVDTFADLATTYPNAQLGWTAWTREVVNGVSKAYRYNGSQWVLQQEFVGDAINEVDDRLTPQLQNINTIKDEQKTAALGENLAVNAFTYSGGWTNPSTGSYAHVTGNTAPLETNIDVIQNRFYQVTFTVNSTNTDHGFGLRFSLAGSQPFEIYQGAGTNITYSHGVQALNESGLSFIPTSSFVGTISNVTVKEIVGTIDSTLKIDDEQSDRVFEMRPTGTTYRNIFIGKNSGLRNTTGRNNTIIGDGAGQRNTSGYFNSVVGEGAFTNNTVGSRNVVVGYTALRDNITGHRNIALGTFALNRNTHGHNNIAIGADSLFRSTTGSHNISLGLTSQENNLTGTGNIAIGYRALLNNTENNYMIAIGYNAALNLRADDCIAIGNNALAEATSGAGNVSIGARSMNGLTTGTNNTAIGEFSGVRAQTGTTIGNVFVGHYAGRALGAGQSNVFLGANSGRYFESGSNNLLLGADAGNTLRTGGTNILIGKDTDVPNATTSGFLNIANGFYGAISVALNKKRFGINQTTPTAQLHFSANSELANTAPIKFGSGNLMSTPENGALEYDGAYLYITDRDGVRKRIATV